MYTITKENNEQARRKLFYVLILQLDRTTISLGEVNFGDSVPSSVLMKVIVEQQMS